MRLLSLPRPPVFLQLILLSITPVPLQGVWAEPIDAGKLRVAETILLYQRSSGGWPKNYDRDQELSQQDKSKIRQDRSNNDTMIDNGATHQEIRLLAAAYQSSGDKRFRDAAQKGIAYLLAGQYDNGGWPQRFPEPQGYAKYITFNDDAMIGVMRLLRDVSRDRETYSFVSDDVRQQCAMAVQRGLTCILECQIRVNGRLTAWCAQHDEKTFQPRKARSYELVSLSGHESVGIVRFLMEIENPSKQVVESIEGAVRWFHQAKLEGIKLVVVKDASKPGGRDKVVVKDPQASPLWARFYDIQTNTPIFCSRDGIPRTSLAEISHERRNGYSWLGAFARDLFARDLPAWKKRLQRDEKQP